MGEDKPGRQGGPPVRPSLGLTADSTMGAAARLCHMLADRKRAVVAGFLTRQAIIFQAHYHQVIVGQGAMQI
jgi:hypothetical protein